MKKRALTILAATVMAASILTGCSGMADIESDYDTESKNLQSMFVVVERCELWDVVYDKDTKVMYAVCFGTQEIL